MGQGVGRRVIMFVCCEKGSCSRGERRGLVVMCVKVFGVGGIFCWGEGGE